MGKSEVNQVIGVCRFSYLGKSGFRASSLEDGALAEMLNAPERLQRRFALFENLCLPSLAAQTDGDFKLMVLVSQALPPKARDRLDRLADRYTFMQLCALPPLGPLQATRTAFQNGVKGNARYITGFRIDDDDAVAMDYIARTRAIADKLLQIGWADPETPAAICFHRGIYWDMNRDTGQFWDYAETKPLGLASAMITVPDSMANIYRWNHRTLAANVRCWIDPSERMFVRTLHGNNDSDSSIPPRAQALPDEQAHSILRTRFGLAQSSIMPKVQ